MSNNIENHVSSLWELENISISHNIIDYHSYEEHTTKNDTEAVRLHFGLQGTYDVTLPQIKASFHLSGHHNNIIYSKGLELKVKNHTKRIETFGINFNTASFIKIAQKGNDPLKKFCEEIVNNRNTILSPEWQTNNFRIQSLIKEILCCPYHDGLKNLFLFSKSIELLVLQASLYAADKQKKHLISSSDRKKLIEVKEFINNRIDNPPTLHQISNQINLNEFKLKRGFKELFGTTIFEYTQNCRMELAKQLLLDTDKTAKEIAYEIGYSSPQHFSKAFKNLFGVTPKSITKTPDDTIISKKL